MDSHKKPVVPAYVELLKPSLTLMSTLTGVGGFALGKLGAWNGTAVIQLLFLTMGTLALGGGAAALNQYMERSSDGLMKRTESRPLPSGKISSFGALSLGVLLTVFGLIYFFAVVNALSGCVAIAISASYLLLYTPLKRRTTFSTLAGAVPGALPPVLGWTAARASIDPDAIILFAILFFWQIPHFLALAWMYRYDYRRAGIRLLSLVDETGSFTSRHALISLSLLLPSSLMPALTRLVSPEYMMIAGLAGGYFFMKGMRFGKAAKGNTLEKSGGVNVSARSLFYASLVYLPLIFLGMLFFKT